MGGQGLRLVSGFPFCWPCLVLFLAISNNLCGRKVYVHILSLPEPRSSLGT
jgi:hypothetical protein